MITLPINLGHWLATELWSGLVVFLRVASAVSLLPAFGEQSVPVRIKLVAAVMFTATIAPVLSLHLPAASLSSTFLFAATETIIGLALGLGLRLFILGLQTAGSIAAQTTSLSQLMGGAAAEPAPAIGHLLVIASLALAMMTGLHVRAAELIIRSYDLLPPGRFPDGHLLSVWGLQQISRIFALAFTLAAPFAISSLLYNVTLGVINRAMPQLMVAFVGAPIITLGGLVLLFLASPIMLEVWSQSLSDFLADPFGATP